MKTDIILSGVGGQGILTIATVIGTAALGEGLNIKQAEVHGMSQRGGDVQSNLRISSEPIWSDLIPRGQADAIIALEPMEALRYLPYLSPKGWIITNSAPFVNITAYPETGKIYSALRSVKNLVMLDVDGIAKENNIARSANIVLLGAASHVIGIEFGKIEEGIKRIFASKGEEVVEMNLRALSIGRSIASEQM